ncbi:hypothetical protein [Mesorhizobium sp. B2-2-3]|uniref:DUF6950 family protein n=1 Tax=Mesorhizobium sp. B2-2-3 TaxID=2589963 RepID=UPI001FF066ED|nr:hypothetical protein [Mesorhizobium sp. B2-2-3]
MANRFEIVAETLKAEMAKPYVYGESDCFFLGCRMADALDTTLGLVKKYSGSYTTLAGAQRALRRRKCKSLVQLFARHLEPCAPAEARTGDLVILQVGPAEHVGICMATRFVTKTERGRADYDLSACKAAFRLG